MHQRAGRAAEWNRSMQRTKWVYHHDTKDTTKKEEEGCFCRRVDLSYYDVVFFVSWW